MNRREYHKIVYQTFDYFGILFLMSSIASCFLIWLLADNPASVMLFPVALIYIWNTNLNIMKPRDAMISMSFLLSSFSLIVTNVFTLSEIKYLVPIAFASMSFIMFIVAALAMYWKIRFSCISAYALASICLIIIFPPFILSAGYSFNQSLIAGVIVLFESALIVANGNYLIVYKLKTDPYLIFLEVSGK